MCLSGGMKCERYRGGRDQVVIALCSDCRVLSGCGSSRRALGGGQGVMRCERCGRRASGEVGVRGLPTFRLADLLGSWRVRVPRVSG